MIGIALTVKYMDTDIITLNGGDTPFLGHKQA